MIREIFKIAKSVRSVQSHVKIFRMPQSIRSGNSHVSSRPVSFPPHPIPGGIPCRSLGTSSRKKKGRQTFGTHGVSGIVFANPNVIISSLSSRIASMEFVRRAAPFIQSREKKRPTHQQWKRVRNKHQFKIREASLDHQPKSQSSLLREDFHRITGQTNNDCRFHSDPHFEMFHASNNRLMENKDSKLRGFFVHNFLRKLCCGPKKWSWLIQWMI